MPAGWPTSLAPELRSSSACHRVARLCSARADDTRRDSATVERWNPRRRHSDPTHRAPRWAGPARSTPAQHRRRPRTPSDSRSRRLEARARGRVASQRPPVVPRRQPHLADRGRRRRQRRAGPGPQAPAPDAAALQHVGRPIGPPLGRRPHAHRGARGVGAGLGRQRDDPVGLRRQRCGHRLLPGPWLRGHPRWPGRRVGGSLRQPSRCAATSATSAA